MRFSELPDKIRVRLTEDVEEALWEEVESRGVAEVAGETGFSRSKLYSWKTRQLFYPASFVDEVLEKPPAKVQALKGGGRSRPTWNVEFPLIEDDELLTRVAASTVVNSDGVPIYLSRERSLVHRFRQLLNRLGEVPVSLYVRSRLELRYPKYLHRIFDRMVYDEAVPALVDEEGRIEGGGAHVRGKLYSLDRVAGELYSRQKRLEVALVRQDGEEVQRLMAGEARDVDRVF